MDTKELKAALTTEDCQILVSLLGGEPVQKTADYILYKTGDHHLDWDKGTPKLYLYKRNNLFVSYTSGDLTPFDIIDLIRKRWTLEGKRFRFRDILEWIADTACEGDLSQNFQRSEWQGKLGRYFRGAQSISLEDKTYDKKVLTFLSPFYHDFFLSDGISAETMKKFEISWYTPKAQIIIPVFDEQGALVGIHARNTIPCFAQKHKYIPLKTCEQDYRFKTSKVLYGLNQNGGEIKAQKKVLIFEAPKSILQLDSMYNKPVPAVATFGMSVSREQRAKLVGMGVNEVILCLDKQYQQVGDKEYKDYEKVLQRIASLFKGYAKVYAVCDKKGLLGYKDSPTDKGRGIWEKLLLGKKLVKNNEK